MFLNIDSMIAIAKQSKETKESVKYFIFMEFIGKTVKLEVSDKELQTIAFGDIKDFLLKESGKHNEILDISSYEVK